MEAALPRGSDTTELGAPPTRILCVDDSAVFLKMCERWLGRDGHAVKCAASAEAALEHLATERVDLVLLDVNLPGLDGFGLLAALRERHHLLHVPVVMMSNDDMESRIVRGIELGAVDFMIKPFSHPALQARVAAALERSRVDSALLVPGPGGRPAGHLAETRQQSSPARMTLPPPSPLPVEAGPPPSVSVVAPRPLPAPAMVAPAAPAPPFPMLAPLLLPAAPSSLPSSLPILVLAVDDSETITRQIEHFLSPAAGYRVTVASSGEEALAILAAAADARAAAAAVAAEVAADATAAEEEGSGGADASTQVHTATSVDVGGAPPEAAGEEEVGQEVGDWGEDGNGPGEESESAAAAAAAAAPLFDVMLLDLIMPGLAGVDVAMRVKSGPPAWASIPILIMSSLDDAETTLDCRALGVDEVLAKPPSNRVLRAAIAAALERSRARGAPPAASAAAAAAATGVDSGRSVDSSSVPATSGRSNNDVDVQVGSASLAPLHKQQQALQLPQQQQQSWPPMLSAAAAAPSDTVAGTEAAGLAPTQPPLPAIHASLPRPPPLTVPPPPPPPPPLVTRPAPPPHPSPRAGVRSISRGDGDSPSSSSQHALSERAGSEAGGDAPGGSGGGGGAVAGLEAEARRMRRLLQRSEARNAELMAAMADMQRSLRTLHSEARELRGVTAAMRDRDREQASAAVALGRRVRALLFEACARGYVPRFYSPCPFRPAPPVASLGTPAHASAHATALAALHHHATPDDGGGCGGSGAPSAAAPGELFAPASLVASLRSCLPLQPQHRRRRLWGGDDVGVAGGGAGSDGPPAYGSAFIAPPPPPPALQPPYRRQVAAQSSGVEAAAGAGGVGDAVGSAGIVADDTLSDAGSSVRSGGGGGPFPGSLPRAPLLRRGSRGRGRGSSGVLASGNSAAAASAAAGGSGGSSSSSGMTLALTLAHPSQLEAVARILAAFAGARPPPPPHPLGPGHAPHRAESGGGGGGDGISAASSSSPPLAWALPLRPPSDRLSPLLPSSSPRGPFAAAPSSPRFPGGPASPRMAAQQQQHFNFFPPPSSGARGPPPPPPMPPFLTRHASPLCDEPRLLALLLPAAAAHHTAPGSAAPTVPPSLAASAAAVGRAAAGCGGGGPLCLPVGPPVPLPPGHLCVSDAAFVDAVCVGVFGFPAYFAPLLFAKMLLSRPGWADARAAAAEAASAAPASESAAAAISDETSSSAAAAAAVAADRTRHWPAIPAFGAGVPLLGGGRGGGASGRGSATTLSPPAPSQHQQEHPSATAPTLQLPPSRGGGTAWRGSSSSSVGSGGGGSSSSSLRLPSLPGSSALQAAPLTPTAVARAASTASMRSRGDSLRSAGSGGGGAPVDLGDSGVRVTAFGRVTVSPGASLSAADVLLFWADLLPALAAGRPERPARFWQLLTAPAHRPFLDGSELRPVLSALIEWHPDLRPLRSPAPPGPREGYSLLVLTSVFASLHGQRAPRISFADVAACNLVDALHVLATQPTRKVLPFSVDYYADATAQWESLAGASHALGLSPAQAAAMAAAEAALVGASAWDRRKRMPPGLATKAALALSPAALLELAGGGGGGGGGGAGDSRLSPLILDRVFAGVPRPLTSGVPDALNYADWLWFWLACADRMAETSLLYWFRALDADGDGFLGEADLRWAVEAKAQAQQQAQAQRPSARGSPQPLPLDSSTRAPSPGVGLRGSGSSASAPPFSHVVTSLFDLVRPVLPGRIAPLDIRRSGAGPLVFDALVLRATPVRAEVE